MNARVINYTDGGRWFQYTSILDKEKLCDYERFCVSVALSNFERSLLQPVKVTHTVISVSRIETE